MPLLRAYVALTAVQARGFGHSNLWKKKNGWDAQKNEQLIPQCCSQQQQRKNEYKYIARSTHLSRTQQARHHFAVMWNLPRFTSLVISSRSVHSSQPRSKITTTSFVVEKRMCAGMKYGLYTVCILLLLHVTEERDKKTHTRTQNKRSSVQFIRVCIMYARMLRAVGLRSSFVE